MPRFRINVLIYGERLFQNVTNRLLEKTVSGIGWVTVSLLQMPLNVRFHEPALTGFEIGYTGVGGTMTCRRDTLT